MDEKIFDFERYATRMHAEDDARHPENEENLERAHAIAEGLYTSLRQYVVRHGYKCSVLRDGDRVILLRDDSTSLAATVQDDLHFAIDMHDRHYDMHSRSGLVNRSDLTHDQIMTAITK